MFSGIVQELGAVRRIDRRSRVTLLDIESDKVIRESRLGDSVSVNGVCLTVAAKEKESVRFEVIPETLTTTNLGLLRPQEKVNLEPALKVGDTISGHFVTGHIDVMGTIRTRKYVQNNLCFEIQVPLDYMKYVLPKGSVAVDGISLTLASKRSNTFGVYIIPHTLKNTTLGVKGPSSRVNIEFDILAKKNEA